MKFRTIPPVGSRIPIKNIFKALVSHKRTEEENTQNPLSLAFDSGSAALLFLLRRLKENHPDKTQVIVPVYTCYSIAAVVEYAGLEIVLCDLDPSTLDFNYTELEDCVSDSTICIISTHFFGRKINLEKLADVKNRHDIVVIEDAAQGGYTTESLNTVSDYIVTSTGRGKPVSTMGGGYLITRQDNDNITLLLSDYSQLESPSKLAGFIIIIKIILVNILLNPYLYTIPFSIPFFRLGETIYPDSIKLTKLTLFQQKLLAYQNSINTSAKRNYHAVVYTKYVNNNCMNMPELTQAELNEYAPVRFPIYLNIGLNKLPAFIIKKLNKYGAVSMYPQLLSDLERVKLFSGSENKKYPGGKHIVNKLITLPTHALLKKQDLEEIRTLLNIICQQDINEKN